MTPPFSQSETNFRFENGGVMGEVLGERGRFGGRESRLSRGGLSPSKVFLPLPILLQSERNDTWVVLYNIVPYTSAEIPPAGAPSGFDSAAVLHFIA